MNRTDYKSAFSQIRPSDSSIERIMEMTNKKHHTNVKRLVACLAAAALIICTLGVVANAATDGAVTEAIAETASQVVEAAETFSRKIHVFVNGEKVEAEVKVEEHTGDDGNPYYSGEVYVTSPDGGKNSRVEFDFDNSEGDIGYGVGEIDIIINDSIEAAIPTTVAAE
ncbi:MAG: hypothetical protein IJN38_05855 [Clostridia bacterium]|nr:hypothetical protein [Clostridia bacterium]